jgi:hypothetical protein
MCDCDCERRANRKAKHIRVSVNRLARDVGSCNFCSDQINEHGTVPNARVVEIASGGSGGMSARLCYDCLAELKRALK